MTMKSLCTEGRPGELRIGFPGGSGDRLQSLEWDRWFETFDARRLVFVYQEHKSDGQQSTCFHFDRPYDE